MPARKNISGRRPSARRMLAAEIARLRQESGKSLGQLAEETTYDRTYLHKLDTGARIGSPEVIAALDKVYGTGDRLMMLWELAREDAFPDKYKRFMELEATATVRYQYSAATVPGLLQSEAYAREVLGVARYGDVQELEERVAARLGRQRLLHQESPPHYRAVLDEAVLRRAVSDPDDWQRQLAHLLATTQLSHVTLQVLPFSAGLHGLIGTSLTLLWQPDGTAVAYTEDSHSGELVEDAGGVERLRLSYDLLRDSALSPRESVAFIQRMTEDGATCEPLDQT
ncbi:MULTISPECIES: helix-turn-helix transcriptional regulator [Streptomyces]|uniref:Helix-turn-helix transcriptional regulator n=1 Tax=Streptomyces lonegramiae TaxID=3075524 RepID=A0ABU2XEP1_9ACTN|nr:helix-turn-helix transcriptional regulator [Streptomyces sp. DSM 41529]MDT0543929.1 helix-turn-helix transcriptional regulator [Streptomyces sp. DSM 41529]